MRVKRLDHFTLRTGTDPNGIAIEFIFGADEHASWAADASGVALSPKSAALT